MNWRRSGVRSRSPHRGRPSHIEQHDSHKQDRWSAPASAYGGFCPDDRHYDVSEVFGLSFPRSIPATKWSMDKGTAHSDSMSARVVDYVYKGHDNYSMRLLVNGKFLIFDASRNLEEHYLVSSLLK